MVLQMTVMLPFLGESGRRDVLLGAGFGWAILLGGAAAIALAIRGVLPWRGAAAVRAWLERFPLGELGPFWTGFTALAAFDVVIQGLASRAFGVPIGWVELAARVPLVYFSFLVPTLGNFGTREVAWKTLFSEFGTADQLVAYAFAVNGVFLVLNLVLGIVFLPRALELASAVRRAHLEGAPLARPALHDPTDQ
jgi:hypothetical protein